MTLRKAKLAVPCMLLGLTCAAGGASAAQKWGVCTPVELMNFPVRVHVRCATEVEQGFIYFAAGTSDPPFAARVLSVIGVAQIMGLNLGILYDPADLSGADIGCQTADCRLIKAVGFGGFTPLTPAEASPGSPTPASLRKECLKECLADKTDCFQQDSNAAWRTACLTKYTACKDEC